MKSERANKMDTALKWSYLLLIVKNLLVDKVLSNLFSKYDIQSLSKAKVINNLLAASMNASAGVIRIMSG